FDDTVYNRGAMTLQMLHKAVGDTAFFTILKKWAADKRDGNGTTAEFIAMAETVSGKKLSDLFDAWLYATKKPALSQRGGRPARLRSRDVVRRQLGPCHLPRSLRRLRLPGRRGRDPGPGVGHRRHYRRVPDGYRQRGWRVPGQRAVNRHRRRVA